MLCSLAVHAFQLYPKDAEAIIRLPEPWSGEKVIRPDGNSR